MDLSGNTASELKWLIQKPMGGELSIYLPKTVRTFNEFMRVDIATGDSDPIYWGIAKSRQAMSDQWATKFCVAMLARYHPGVACKAASTDGPEDFWRALRNTFEKGSERSRGSPILLVIDRMEKFSPDPTGWFDKFPPTFIGVKAVCENQLYGFGPYFQLKVCDYLMCLGRGPKSYAGLGDNLSKSPSQALAMFGGTFNDLCREVERWEILAAPYFDRIAGPAEVETSLCGWKTTKTRGNWFGADIEEKRNGLKGFGPDAARFSDWLPMPVSKDTFTLELENTDD